MPKVHNLQKKILKPTSCESLILVCFTSIPPEPEPKLKPKVKKVKGKGHHTLIHVFYWSAGQVTARPVAFGFVSNPAKVGSKEQKTNRKQQICAIKPNLRWIWGAINWMNWNNKIQARENNLSLKCVWISPFCHHWTSPSILCNSGRCGGSGGIFYQFFSVYCRQIQLPRIRHSVRPSVRPSSSSSQKWRTPSFSNALLYWMFSDQ